ncbi:cytidylyltransferase family protein [Synechococcus sp. A18-46.1]|nr:cytidylyltransferase family protein [Synechococcus sp. A18-46.1]
MNNQLISILIPARLESSRLPRKMLLPVRNNTPLIHETYLNVVEAIRSSRNPSTFNLFVATDSNEIADYLDSQNISVIFTSSDHDGGLSRCHEASLNLSSQHFLIIQGDEPLVTSQMLDSFSAYHLNLPSESAICSTMATYHDSSQNGVKIVVSNSCRALYMTRCVLPNSYNVLTHLGIYGFSKLALSSYISCNCELSSSESIELLRFITNDFYVHVHKSPFIATRFGIDTQDDLLKYQKLFPTRSTVLDYLS